MADLSFIEDSVAFPEKEEDEEEEEEGVEWGYEEGNPPRVLRLARGVGPAALASSLRLRRPSFSRGSPARLGAAGAPGRAGFSGSPTLVPGSGWHLPPSGGRARRLRW